MNTKLFVLFGLLFSFTLGPMATAPLFANYDHQDWRGWSSCHDGHHWWNRHHHDNDRHHDKDHHGGHGDHRGGHGHHDGGKHH